jgi:hypothetical protein
MPSDGCETNITMDDANCGACFNACVGPHSMQKCSNSACQVVSCDAGRTDCNKMAADGCEAATATDPTNCGACGTVCMVPANATAGCAGGMCGIGKCTLGFLDCNKMAADGCEISRLTDLQNCGACNHACVEANATPVCKAGNCAVSSCNANFSDCNQDPIDGCEVNQPCCADFQHDPNNCGVCGMVCPNNLPHCNMAVCSVAPVLIGQFAVGDGPQWGGNPPTYTCLEACALLFGGDPLSYSCSTDPNNIDKLAFEDGYADDQHCQPGNAVAQDYKLSDTYNCGAKGCSYSAYVNDHGCKSVNYCFQ